MMQCKFLSLLMVGLFILFGSTVSYSTAVRPPQVVVSITPFYGLVASVMEGVGTPQLLVQPGASPHHYALRSSEIQLLKTADILFWAGPTLETFLVKPLATITYHDSSLKMIALEKTPQLLRLPLRHNAIWSQAPHATRDKIALTNADIDMHFWLDPHNALFMTDYIVKTLETVDPVHALHYQENGKKLKDRLKKLDAHIATQLKSVKDIPYVVFHDAYQYFEHRYGLNSIGSITLHPEMPPTAKRLKTIRTMLQNTKARCVFSEPQFRPKLVENMMQDLDIKQGELDPEGQGAQKNINGYFQLLENLSGSIKSCLSQ